MNATTDIGKKILVVEDDPSISELLKIVLEDQNYEVDLCMDGAQVETRIQERVPDLILLDLWIPGMDGEKVTYLLKSNVETRNIPVVIVSAQNDLPVVVKKIGADGYLSKPFDLDNLLNTIYRLINF